ncbi:Alanyl-tRNA synthetase (Alanine--tRNA ligase) (AlaRS) [Scheffersomyces stipitis CBS 6054]|uniref:Alanyl-tRNA synthetase (Alanine--tRNA ligase) (AlaRS) n=1 Tax=Scheffersomyces stipitis (strain ATCC 58785 / CBS 6054 / NBRC 10063 / NRRL Y-11545) TaxID=322104 RepID=A3GI00_PICST|nr:Alanyl-tRNA synthetase (Alanine--tRNA ligase) (AlaRS) [Scheffersomyces stipitis CBS 6054]EAZ62906.1 Alanyl-tRNA synthetase (Alanine--tRNA ligase) (AlaRS) [Scheffersomyces stipitis CBS 6054]
MTTVSSTIVGALACQRNSFLKTFKTQVVSSFEYQNKNKKVKDEAPKEIKYAVELEDTILFPEGGGQPYDKGSLTLPNNEVVHVTSVLRDKLTALHITDAPVEPGTEVTVDLDWDRRIDLMQQHTGQHLLSAVFDTYKLETLSWSMGEIINYIELPEKVSDEIVAEVNAKVNKLIFEAIPIEVVTPDQHGGELDYSHIPDDYDLSQGIIRIVKIGQLDANPCCGTHLSSTSQIQSMSLLHQVSVRGGHSRLYFICGTRVYKYLSKQHELLKLVSGTHLSCQIEEVADKVALLNSNYRKALSREQNLLKELAADEASRIFTRFKNTDAKVDYVYRAENSPEFLILVQKELTTLINSDKESGTVVLFNGDYPSGTGGMVKILGPQAEVLQSELKSKIKNLKGGGKGNSFQGKIAKYEKGELETLFTYLDTFRN